MKELRDNVTSTAEQFRAGANGDQDYDRMLRQQERSMLQQIDRQSRQISTTVLRHEGSHQLFHTLGIHSSFHAENVWLMEGLAVYCEGDRPGAILRPNAQLVLAAVRDGKNIPLSELVNHRSSRGLLAFDETRSQGGAYAYAQSWALVHYLLHTSHRPKFEAFIRHIRQRENLREVAVTPQMEILLRFLEMEEDALEQNVRRHLAGM